MRKMLRQTTIVSMILVLGISTACSSTKQESKGIQQNERKIGTHGLSVQNDNVKNLTIQSQDDAVIAITPLNHVSYVAVPELAKVLKFNTGWQGAQQTLLLGDNDANFELSMNSTKASKDGTQVQVNEPFLKQGEIAYIPVSALRDLFHDDMAFNVNNGQLHIHPTSQQITVEHEDDRDDTLDTAEFDFKEDPSDPFKKPNESSADFEHSTVWSQHEIEESVPVLKHIDTNNIISKAKQYLGVKYLFGAGPYPQTGQFDCSTFTQYVYGKQGVNLPRLARQQAASGTLISRKNLRKGDLLFFYVPGRFKSNRTVGHVGIYMGDMMMIHASPSPKDGVQISSIDKAYWKRTFLSAKRVAY
jgi:cell wall-associated NlpC family hydrolase